MDRQAEIPNEADEFQVIVQGQLRVEAALQEHAAAAVVLEFLEFGGQFVPGQDIAVR